MATLAGSGERVTMAVEDFGFGCSVRETSIQPSLDRPAPLRLVFWLELPQAIRAH